MNGVFSAAVAGLILFLLLKTGRSEFSLPLQWGLCAFFFFAVLPQIGSVLSYTKTLTASVGLSGQAELWIRILGVGLISGILGETARDAGAGTLAAGVELAGRATVLFLILPIVKGIVDLFREGMV